MQSYICSVLARDNDRDHFWKHSSDSQNRFGGINFIIFSIKDRESNSVITFLGVRVIVLSLSKLKLLNAGQHSFLFIKNGCHISRNSYIADF